MAPNVGPDIDGAPVYALHMAQCPDEHAKSLPVILFVLETPEGAARSPKELLGAVKESQHSSYSPGFSFASWPMEPDAVERTTPAPSEYQTYSTA